MQISARNQLSGTVTNVTVGNVMAEVVVDVGGQDIVAAITRASAEQLGLDEGQGVTVVIKATDVCSPGSPRRGRPAADTRRRGKAAARVRSCSRLPFASRGSTVSVS